jgi:hypothetical protein
MSRLLNLIRRWLAFLALIHGPSRAAVIRRRWSAAP